MSNDIGGVWRTVGGRRIFIKDGQDLASAMKESGKFSKNNKDKIEKLKEKLNDAKGFLERAKIQNEITALEKGFNNFDEYEKSKQDNIFQKAILKDENDKEYKIVEEQLTNFVTEKNIDVSDWQNCDSNLQEEYSKKISYSSKMQKISKKEYDDYTGIELSRVVTGNSKNDSNKIVVNSKNGEIQYSDERRSYYGKGLYYGVKEIESKLLNDYGNKNSSIINCKISKTANILEVNDINDYIKKSNTLARGFKDDKLRTFFDNPAKNRNIMFMNAGIDIIKVKRDNYYIILNRGVLITYDE